MVGVTEVNGPVGVTGADAAAPVVVSEGDVVTTSDGPGVSLGLEQEAQKRATGVKARSAAGEVREMIEPKRCFIGCLTRSWNGAQRLEQAAEFVLAPSNALGGTFPSDRF